MPKTVKSLKIGHYELEIDPEETARQYAAMPPFCGSDVGQRFFRYLLPRAKEESLLFLRELGIDPAKLYLARPVAEPDEKGEVLFLCSARLCGRLLRGFDAYPRKSVEQSGLSMVFVSDRRQFHEGLMNFPDPEIEFRFVIPLPFDPDFFKAL